MICLPDPDDVLSELERSSEDPESLISRAKAVKNGDDGSSSHRGSALEGAIGTGRAWSSWEEQAERYQLEMLQVEEERKRRAAAKRAAFAAQLQQSGQQQQTSSSSSAASTLL
eukprot:CAMPEP_0169471962 /NCGR_PEP_ID=MMETSP1042-20121227/24888_1 /TAXON_ID=464988 /ORGANISM="Hemiselmis andersenii, Strain CCMP1180" /LENGTH=112 /DNA_ID=CAMNT_0009585731 /DNA_START=57 /DNA_END=391 /DNA_ORIENTATION=+